MPIHRRSLLAAVGATLALPALADIAAADPRLADRAAGAADAPVVVQEFFSLTCVHCAAFAREVFPKIETDLIKPGKLHYVFRDFPLDQVALHAAMIARTLPADRYEPFVMALFATQDRWAFAPGVNSTEELAKMAALAGMPRGLFDATLRDDGLQKSILAAQQAAQKRYGIDSTPTFLFNGPKAHDDKLTGELTYAVFAQHVGAAA